MTGRGSSGSGGGSPFRLQQLLLGNGGSSSKLAASSVRSSSAPPGADAAQAAAAAAALQQASINTEQDAASREAQDASYEEGLPYLRGMPEAFARCADVMLAVRPRELPVHSQVLASKSAFFAGMWADMGDFENSGKPDPASAHVTPKTAIGGALSGRKLRDVLLFLDAVYRGIGPLNLADAKSMAAMGDEFHCPDILRRCDDYLSSSAGVSAARLEALTGGPGSSGPDPDVFAEYAVFAERAGLSAFQAKWEAVLIDDWEIARQSRGLLQLAPETLLRVANGHDFLRRHGHRPPSKLLRKWRRTADLSLDQ